MAPQKRNNRSMTRRDFLILTGAATGLLVLEACGPSAPTEAPAIVPASEVQRGGTLRVAFPGAPGTLDPALTTTNEDYNITYVVYSRLVWVDHALTPQPDMAESWSASDDLKTWTFKLRQGAKFHHGTPFTADDVVYTFERIMDPDLASPLRSVLSFVDQVEKVDDHTARFHLSSPSADFHLILGAPQTGIVPHDRTAEQLAAEAFGSGPFKVTEYVPGDHTTMVRNETYWEEGLPYLDQVRHVYMPEAATQVAALTGGSIDMIWQLGFENIPTIEGNPDVVVGEVQSGLYQPIVMRTTEEPFTDKRVRLALKYCADRTGIRQIVTQGRGDPGNDQPIPPVNPFWADVPIRERNIEKAKELLAEAGYADGLDLTLITSTNRPGWIEQAVAFQEMAKPAGVNVKLERVPADLFWGEYWMKVPLFMSNWNFRVSADEILSLTYHSQAKWNESDFRSPELDQLIETARGEKDPEKRKELYGQAEKLLSDEGGVIIAFFKPLVMAMRKEVQDFHPHPGGYIQLRSTWLSETA